MSGVQPPAPHDALGDFALPAGRGGDGAAVPFTEAAPVLETSLGRRAAPPPGASASAAAAGAGAASTEVASVDGVVSAGVAGGGAAAGGLAASGASGAALARSALLQPNDVPAPSTASAVTNVSTVSEGLRIAAS